MFGARLATAGGCVSTMSNGESTVSRDESGAEAFSSANSILPTLMIVAAPDEDVAREFETMLTAQHWHSVRVVHPVEHAVAEAQRLNASAVFMMQGTVLLPMALESAWWVLDTTPQCAFVAFA